VHEGAARTPRVSLSLLAGFALRKQACEGKNERGQRSRHHMNVDPGVVSVSPLCQCYRCHSVDRGAARAGGHVLDVRGGRADLESAGGSNAALMTRDTRNINLTLLTFVRSVFSLLPEDAHPNITTKCPPGDEYSILSLCWHDVL